MKGYVSSFMNDTSYPNVPRILPKVYTVKHKDMTVETTVFFDSGMVSWFAENIEYWYEETTKIVAFDVGTGKATEEPCSVKRINQNLK